MASYVSKCTLDVNGVSISDFKSFTKDAVVHRKQVNLMDKTGHIKTTPRFGFALEYVIPSVGRFDFDSVENGRVTVE
jgi:hypothetical protein